MLRCPCVVHSSNASNCLRYLYGLGDKIARTLQAIQLFLSHLEVKSFCCMQNKTQTTNDTLLIFAKLVFTRATHSLKMCQSFSSRTLQKQAQTKTNGHTQVEKFKEIRNPAQVHVNLLCEDQQVQIGCDVPWGNNRDLEYVPHRFRVVPFFALHSKFPLILHRN